MSSCMTCYGYRLVVVGVSDLFVSTSRAHFSHRNQPSKLNIKRGANSTCRLKIV